MQEAPAFQPRDSLSPEKAFPFEKGIPDLPAMATPQAKCSICAVLPKITVPQGFLRPSSLWSGPCRCGAPLNPWCSSAAADCADPCMYCLTAMAMV